MGKAFDDIKVEQENLIKKTTLKKKAGRPSKNESDKSKQPFTIRFTMEELTKVKRYLGSRLGAPLFKQMILDEINRKNSI